MAKPKSLYIFEGEKTFAITRGHPFENYEDKDGSYCRMKIKHRGLIGKYFEVAHIPQLYVGQPKRLFIKNKLLPQWQVIRVKMDLNTKTFHLPDIDPHLVSRIKSLENERLMYKTLYFQEKEKNMDREQKDRYREKVMKDAELAGKVKNKLYGSGIGGYDIFGRSLLGGGLGTQPPSTE